MLAALALPQYGLSTVFVIAFISATLLPLGSEPALFGLVKLNADMLWPGILAAAAGNTLGGAVTYWMGFGAETLYERFAHKKGGGRALAFPGVSPSPGQVVEFRIMPLLNQSTVTVHDPY